MSNNENNDPFFMKRFNALNFYNNNKRIRFNNREKPATPSNNALSALKRQPSKSILKQVPRLNTGNSTNQSAVLLHQEVIRNQAAFHNKAQREAEAALLRAQTNAMLRGRRGGTRRKKRTLKRTLKRK
jgi:hypothetical protein